MKDTNQGFARCVVEINVDSGNGIDILAPVVGQADTIKREVEKWSWPLSFLLEFLIGKFSLQNSSNTTSRIGKVIKERKGLLITQSGI